jgi:hypothetical protein
VPINEPYEGYTGPFSLNIYYTTGPIQFNYSDSSFLDFPNAESIPITRGVTATSPYNNYSNEFPYSWKGTAGTAYQHANGNFTPEYIPPI